jgi:hypothetical protein
MIRLEKANNAQQLSVVGDGSILRKERKLREMWNLELVMYRL